jgi:hypothetical protein
MSEEARSTGERLAGDAALVSSLFCPQPKVAEAIGRVYCYAGGAGAPGEGLAGVQAGLRGFAAGVLGAVVRRRLYHGRVWRRRARVRSGRATRCRAGGGGRRSGTGVHVDCGQLCLWSPAWQSRVQVDFLCRRAQALWLRRSSGVGLPAEQGQVALARRWECWLEGVPFDLAAEVVVGEHDGTAEWLGRGKRGR